MVGIFEKAINKSPDKKNYPNTLLDPLFRPKFSTTLDSDFYFSHPFIW